MKATIILHPAPVHYHRSTTTNTLCVQSRMHALHACRNWYVITGSVVEWKRRGKRAKFRK